MREQLQRVLRTPEVLFIGINGVVGGGIFLLPGQVAERAGAAAVWAYLAAGVVVGLIGFSFAEVSTMYDRTGGPLVYAQVRAGYEGPWNFWPGVRTVFSSLAFLALIGVCLSRSGTGSRSGQPHR